MKLYAGSPFNFERQHPALEVIVLLEVMIIIAQLTRALAVAALSVAVAVLSIQNIAPISLQWLGWRSVEIPFGVAIASSISIGWILGALSPLLLARR